MVRVWASTRTTFVAATPPTVTVAPASNARPLTFARVPPAAGPTAGVSDRTKRGENSEVFPPGSVAVAVTGEPFGIATGSTTLKVALPEPSVVTCEEPR